jgi:hypothetical protein
MMMVMVMQVSGIGGELARHGRLRVGEARVATHEQVGLVLVGGRCRGATRVNHGGGGVGGRGRHRRRLIELRQAREVELVGVALAVHLGHDVLVVVVAQSAAQLVVVHVGLALALAPPPRHLVRIDELELAVGALPADDARIVGVRQQLEQKLPQLNLTGAGRAEAGRRVGENLIRVLHARAEYDTAARMLLLILLTMLLLLLVVVVVVVQMALLVSVAAQGGGRGR